MMHLGRGSRLGATAWHGSNSLPVAAVSNGSRSCVTMGAGTSSSTSTRDDGVSHSGLDLLLLRWRLLVPGMALSSVLGSGAGEDGRYIFLPRPGCRGAVEPGSLLS
ncbi:hypothetical protein GWK47_018153 [Chionoecetes opilio]|uniref:Uncharacterized protein n=1 Tax=Chionoecetes opilio TaxID=41210 RepID=A0A8J5CIS1_CHIOP|nr:hypothetical protein GWK47_018153 [Chionoecetes opilio]